MNGKRLTSILFAGIFLSLFILVSLNIPLLQASKIKMEPVNACVFARGEELTAQRRAYIAQCLGWQNAPTYSICHGSYLPLNPQSLANDDEVRILADKVSFYHEGRSELSGNVEIQQISRIVNAQTAYVYRDAKSNQITQIELLGEVKYLEPERLMIARKASVNPKDKSGKAEDVLYRFNSQRPDAALPAWGQASTIERFANKDYFLKSATYTTCAPQDNAWHIEAEKINLDNTKNVGVARDAKLYLGPLPILYTPYFSFPTSKERKSGFLLPTIGSSSAGGLDFALPYYWNIASNYDATLIPHIYSERGLMLGGQFRYLTEKSFGESSVRFLPNDKAYKNFILNNEVPYPRLQDSSTDRWSAQVVDTTQINPNLRFRVNFQQVSDDYYLQDFSNNLAILTERQLLREGELSYVTDNWFFRGMLQSYQTLQPINQTPVDDIYQRLPQLLAVGTYDDLPFRSHFSVLAQFDDFKWPNHLIKTPQGPRYYLNPILSIPHIKPWGYITPSVEFVQNAYDVNNYNGLQNNAQFQRTMSRQYVDSGLFFERDMTLFNNPFIQTLEPRLYYLNVPFRNQTPIPVYDSAYYIFNADQLFRTNRFSGFDRVGDANQLSYAVTSRWISHKTGAEKASVTVGQIRYFSDRQVKLCQNPSGNCIDDPLTLGYLSPLTRFSPIASRATYHFNPFWSLNGDYVWDGSTHATNNGHVDFHYQPAPNKIIGFGYTYMVLGDITQVANTKVDINPLHQSNLFYAWPFNDRWSTVGAYGYNISKRYEMMSLLGLQYDNCCWALRLIGGRSFQSLSPTARPQYNNNVYLQVQLKGLGSVGNSDPVNALRTFIPGYVDSFHRS